jgi:carboxyl-terminal processing protease
MIKMNKQKIRVFFVLNIVIVILIANCSFSWAGGAKSDENPNLDYIKSILDMIGDKYKGDIDQDKLMQGVLKGIFGSMDQYTEFYTKDEAAEFFNTIDGEYSGVGMAFDEVNGSFLVREVYKDSPAEKAGISEGDRLVEIDGQALSGISSSEVVKMITGEKGTEVVLSIKKDEEKNARSVTIVRDEIRINPVTTSVRDDVGYIKLTIFNNNSADEMKKALREMDDKKIKKIILDLRDNPGGDVNQVVEIAKNFIPEGLITKLDFKSENIGDMEFKSTLKEKKYKLAVLVNQNSASASEILSGAVQDTGAGTLIGTKTFGKAKVQNIYPILTLDAYKKYEQQLGVRLVIGDDLERKYNITPQENELIGWIKITTGLYYTPKGRMIDLKGIIPDYNVTSSNIINDVDLSSIRSLRMKIKPQLNSETYDVLNAKKILKILGYKIDYLNNYKLDFKTCEELKRFQKKSGLYPSGILDFSTQKALNEAYQKLALSSDKPYMKALEVLNK